jgi:hypothetical protein
MCDSSDFSTLRIFPLSGRIACADRSLSFQLGTTRRRRLDLQQVLARWRGGERVGRRSTQARPTPRRCFDYTALHRQSVGLPHFPASPCGSSSCFGAQAQRTWNLRSRACLAEPPAESPSTRKISVSARLVDAQSASLPGSVDVRSSDLRRTISRARFAASAAWRERRIRNDAPPNKRGHATRRLRGVKGL